MRSSSHSGSPERNTDRSQTIHPKRDRGHRPNQLFVVGIGPGSPNHLTKRAIDVLASVEVVAGYTTYIDLIRPLIEDKKIISTGMTKEVHGWKLPSNRPGTVNHVPLYRAEILESMPWPGWYLKPAR